MIGFIFALIFPAFAADVPFYLQAMEDSKDVSAINENFRSLQNYLTALENDVSTLESATTGCDEASNCIWTGTHTFQNYVQFNSTVAIGSTGKIIISSTAAAGRWARSQADGRLEWVDASFLPIDPIPIGIKVVLSGSKQGGNFVDATTSYYAIGIPAITITNSTETIRLVDESETEIVAFKAGTLKNLSCKVGDSNSADGAAGFTVRKNGAETSMSCSVNSDNGTCTNVTNTVSLAVGDRFSLKGSCNAQCTQYATNGSCYFQYEF